MDASFKSFPFAPAPEGSPDRYTVTKPVTLFWRNPPAKYLRRIKCPYSLDDGYIWADNAHGVIKLHLSPGFCFDVSVAPSAAKAMPGAAAHDFIYAHVDTLAKAWRCSPRQVLKLADHWFLALMRNEEFFFSRTYFLGVSLFGFWYNRLTRRFNPQPVTSNL